MGFDRQVVNFEMSVKIAIPELFSDDWEGDNATLHAVRDLIKLPANINMMLEDRGKDKDCGCFAVVRFIYPSPTRLSVSDIFDLSFILLPEDN